MNEDGLPDYERGFLDALYLYAWMKDGVLYVGSTGRRYRDAKDEFLRERGSIVDPSDARSSVDSRDLRRRSSR